MNSIQAALKERYSENALEAGDRLLRVVKQKILREHGKIDYLSLKRNGYSEELLSRLEEIQA